jgi:hypothetical protein
MKMCVTVLYIKFHGKEGIRVHSLQRVIQLSQRKCGTNNIRAVVGKGSDWTKSQYTFTAAVVVLVVGLQARQLLRLFAP